MPRITPLRKVLTIVPPPDVSVGHNDEADWSSVETSLQMSLPEDYKALVDEYGAGVFCDEMVLLPRVGRLGELSLHTFIGSASAELRAIRKVSPAMHGVPLWPELQGLVPFAPMHSEATLCWLPNHANPDRWTCTLLPHNGLSTEDYPLTVAEFLLSWFSGALESDLIATIAAVEQPYFVPDGTSIQALVVRLYNSELSVDDRLDLVATRLGPHEVVYRSHSSEDGLWQIRYAKARAGWNLVHRCGPDSDLLEVQLPVSDVREFQSFISTVAEAMGVSANIDY